VRNELPAGAVDLACGRQQVVGGARRSG
jgi:hypothetical protein